MKKFKLVVSLLVCLLVFASVSVNAFSVSGNSRDFGVVDLNKVVDNYTKAQEVSAELKVKESELQKFVMKAQQKVKNAKTPLEKKNLEEKFGEEFNIKRQAFVKEQSEKWEAVENDIYDSIEEIYKDKKFDMVFNKQGVIIGGEDITDELIKKLNKEAKK